MTTTSRPSALPPGHPAVAFGRVGVLLVNLGTPDRPEAGALRRYLAEFLSDPRVIELPRWKWYPVLYGIILNTRPARKAREYAAIWNRERDEGPLLTATRGLAEALAPRLADLPAVVVDYAMRYGNPAIADRMAALRAAGADRILVVPLYPQYAAAASATVNDAVFRYLLGERWQAAIRTAPPYYDDPVYIDAIARSIEVHLATLDFEPELVIASFHGIPQSYFDKGDPYYCHCRKTVRLLAERLGWPEDRLPLTFQSRFGPEEWLRPYTDATVAELAAGGVRRLCVVTPGFAADCLETIEEIGVGTATVFAEAGGERFSRIPCLNDGVDGVGVIETVVRRELSGWAG